MTSWEGEVELFFFLFCLLAHISLDNNTQQRIGKWGIEERSEPL